MSSPLILRPGERDTQRWHVPTDMAHLQSQALVPLQAAELAKAATTMPIALVKLAGQWQLMAVCGLEPNRNLLVRDGKWVAGGYRPRWVYSYPFDIKVVGSNGVITFDQKSGLLAADGEPFFDEAGQFTPIVAKRVELLKELPKQQAITKKAVDALVKANVLMPWPQSMCEQLGMKIKGLHLINERALSELDDAAYLSLRKAQAIAVAYAVNLSVYQARHLREAAEQLSAGEVNAGTGTLQTMGDLDLEFLNDSDTIKFGPLS